jgi:hypothetical protein
VVEDVAVQRVAMRQEEAGDAEVVLALVVVLQSANPV